jgi:hypothetical protein
MNEARLAAFDRHTQIGDLAAYVRLIIGRLLPFLAAVLVLETAYLGFTQRPGFAAFGLISLGTWVALAVWCRTAIGLPLLPLIVLQHLFTYGMPIVLNHPSVTAYGPDYVVQAGVEVLVESLAVAAAWRAGMELFRPSAPYSLALADAGRFGLAALKRLGIGLILAVTAYRVLQGLGVLNPLLNKLPAGSASIIVALVSACSTCGFFVTALCRGSGKLGGTGALALWSLLAVNTVIAASGFLLSASAIDILAVGIGLFWGSGKVPWRSFLILGAALSFLNSGKFVMRARYWSQDPDAPPPQTSLLDIPSQYSEWAQASFKVLTETPSGSAADWGNDLRSAKEGHQSIFDRIDDLQSLLFVIAAVNTNGIPVLKGASYAVIPALFIPRIFWPDKPRTHAGQVMLNVHFGRQELSSTFSTYIAWGLLPEAYGNFGPYWGAIILGGVLGLLFAWLENATARKPIISLEGFLCFDVFLNVANAFEMVSSVLITSLLQSVVVIVAACAFFVRRTRTDRPQSAQP